MFVNAGLNASIIEPELVSTISHRMIVMKDGRIVDEGTPARLLKASKNKYTKRLVESSIF